MASSVLVKAKPAKTAANQLLAVYDHSHSTSPVEMKKCNDYHCYLRYTPDAPMFRNPHASLRRLRDPSSLLQAIAEAVDKRKLETLTACR